MSLVVQVILTGLAAGAGYGLIAIGFALVYRLTGVVHFALGELLGLTILVALLVAAGTGPVTQTNVSAGRVLGAIGAGLAVAGATGVLAYLVAVRPFVRRGDALGWIGSLVALAFAVRGLLAATLVRPGYVFPDPIPFGRLGNDGILRLGGGAAVPVRAFFVILVGVGLAGAAAWLLDRSRFGLGLRALADDVQAGTIVGLPVDRLLAGAFGLAGILAGVAAITAAPGSPVSAGTGTLLGLKGLVAALLGRFGSSWTVFVAGLAVGLLETSVTSVHLGAFRPGPAYRDIVPLALAVALVAAGRMRRAPAETG